MEAVWQIVALGLLGAVLAALLKKAYAGAGAAAGRGGMRGGGAGSRPWCAGGMGLSGGPAGGGGDLLHAVSPLLKTAGIAVVTRIGADLCRDAGESAVASAVEMAGAMGALLAVLPLMQAAWEVLRSLL